MDKLGSDTRLVQHPDHVAADVDGETVMMGIYKGAYYGIKGVAARTWTLLEEPHTLAELCSILCAEYEVDEPTCRTEVQAFVEELLEQELVRRC